ncbi:MAG: hypothetical protein JAZ17_16620, partial [Candidatus Thiodiazotropha endolucinida]|nr:hypothetical protein [Candidatus Thiodiazotropha endolucinida]
MITSNSFKILGNICDECNGTSCACNIDNVCAIDNTFSVNSNSVLNINDSNTSTGISISKPSIRKQSKQKGKMTDSFVGNKTSLIDNQTSSGYLMQPDFSDQNSYAKMHGDSLNFDLVRKGLNFGHLNVQGLCGQNMSKFAQLEAML